MKKTRNLLLAAMVLAVVSLAACQKDNEKTAADKQASAARPSKTLTLSDAEREQIAQNFALAMDDANAYSQLWTAVDEVYNLGAGEKVYFYDILNPTLSKFLSDDLPLSSLQQAVNLSGILVSCGVNGQQYMGNLQIYWPFHDDWDGIVTPTVIFAPNNMSTDVLHGFRRGSNGNLQLIQIGVRDLDNENSYILIKEAEKPYTYYPRFKDGIYTKDGHTWYKPNSTTGQDGDWSFLNQAYGGDTLVEGMIKKFKSNGHFYDGWLDDDCEFVISFTFLLSGENPCTEWIHFVMTRKQIKQKKTIPINYIFNGNWSAERNLVYYRLYEEDHDGSTTQINITLVNGDETVSLSQTINDPDDEMVSGYFDRANFVSNCQMGNDTVLATHGDKFYYRARFYSSPF